MSRPAFTIAAFGVYLFALGWVLLLVPNLLLGAFGFAPTTEIWIRVLGVAVVNLGVYYRYAAKSEAGPFFAASVYARLFAFLAFGTLVLLGLAKPALALFGVVDASGGVWTWLALRKAPARA